MFNQFHQTNVVVMSLLLLGFLKLDSMKKIRAKRVWAWLLFFTLE